MIESIVQINEMLPWYFPFVFFVLGSCFGSFLNVCIYRIPAGLSIIHPGSRCACGQAIKWYDNIPILSWFILRGKARCCGRRFSFRYPFVEALTGLVFLVIWLVYPWQIALCYMLLSFLLIGSAFVDLDHMIIPDSFSIGGTLAGCFLALMLPQLHVTIIGIGPLDALRGLFSAMLSVLIASGIILWLGLLTEVVLKRDTMGMGDVKLMGAIGAFAGWKAGLFALFGGSVIGVVIVALVVVYRQFRPAPGDTAADSPEKTSQPESKDIAFDADSRQEEVTAATSEGDAAEERSSKSAQEEDSGYHQVPFGPMLALGALVYILVAKPYFDATIDELLFLFSEAAWR